MPGYFITPNSKVRKVFCFLQSACFQHHNKVIYDCSCPWPIWRTDIGMVSTDEPILRLRYINQTWMRLLSNTCELRVWVWEIFSTWKGGHALCSDRPSHRVQPLLLGLFPQFQWSVVQQLTHPPSTRGKWQEYFSLSVSKSWQQQQVQCIAQPQKAPLPPDGSD